MQQFCVPLVLRLFQKPAGCVVRNCKAQLKAFAKHYRRTQVDLGCTGDADFKNIHLWFFMNRAGQLKTCERITRYMCTYNILSTFHVLCLPNNVPLWEDVDISLIRDCNDMLQRDLEKYEEMVSHWSGVGLTSLTCCYIKRITSLLNEGGTHFGWGIICLSIPVEHGFRCLEEVFCLSHMANWFRSSLSTFTGSPSLFQRKYIPYITSYGKLMFSLCSCSDITTWLALLLLPCYVTHQNPLDLCSMALLTILKVHIYG